MSTIDLSLLPPPDVIETLDFEDLYQECLAEYRELMGDAYTAALESDPIVKLLELIAYRIVRERARVNDAAQANYLTTALQDDLENLGAFWNVGRLTIREADPTAVPPVAAVMESDSRLRMRIQLAMEGYSTAGPAGAYRFHALSASALVKDVSVVRPVQGTVRVTVLSTEGDGTPDSSLLSQVAAALNDEEVRPLCDTVEVVAAQIVPWALDATLYFYAGPDKAVVLANALAAAQAYAAERLAMGQDIARSGIFAALHQPGVQRVELRSPAADLVITKAQAPYCTSMSVVGGGIDE